MNITLFYSYVVWSLIYIFFCRLFLKNDRFLKFGISFLSLIFLLIYNGNYFAAVVFLLLINVLIQKIFSKKIRYHQFFPLIYFVIFFSFFKYLRISAVGFSYLLLAFSMDVRFLKISWKRQLLAMVRHGSFERSFMGPVARIRDQHKIFSDNIQIASKILFIGLVKIFIGTYMWRSFFPERDFVHQMTSLGNFGKGLWNYINLYFEFSGFTDTVVGLYLFSGRSCPSNFNRPYLSTSLKDFWNSWHMSLGAFIRKHIYIPLGGSHHGSIRTAINLCIAMTLCGLWHGLQWNFILWGFLQGVGISLERILKLDQRITLKPVRWLITQTFVTYSWALFFSTF